MTSEVLRPLRKPGLRKDIRFLKKFLEGPHFRKKYILLFEKIGWKGEESGGVI